MAIECSQVYHDSLAELDTQASSAIPSMKSAIFGRLALQYDQLLEDLEGEDRSYYSSILPFFSPLLQYAYVLTERCSRMWRTT